MLDGEEVPIHRVDHALMGVWVPGGAEEVVFEYRPGTFRTGLVLSGVALLVLLALGVRPLLAGRSPRP